MSEEEVPLLQKVVANIRFLHQRVKSMRNDIVAMRADIKELRTRVSRLEDERD